MRLDRFLSETTGMSRKEAVREIHKGDVLVDGEPVTKGAVHVSEQSEVVWNHNRLQLQGPTYLMLHKPTGCVCSNADDQHITVFAYLDEPNPAKLHTAGRLDLETSGILLITSDGQWSHRVTSPRHECKKVYRVQVAETLRPKHAEKFAEGIMLRGEKEATKPAALEILSDHEALVTISEGRYHQVRRMFAAIGNRVTGLHREQIGGLKLDPALAPGEYRELTAEEVKLF